MPSAPVREAPSGTLSGARSALNWRSEKGTRELVPVGHQQLYWRVVADEQALAATQAETVKLVLEPSDRELLAAAARLPL